MRNGDTIRIDFNKGRCDMLVDEAEIARRKAEGIPQTPADATPWQMLYRQTVTQLADGATIRDSDKFRQLAKTPPRHNH